MTLNPKQRQNIQDTLERLKSEIKPICGAVLVAFDGLMIAHATEDESTAEQVAAMSAAMHALGEKISGLLQLGQGDTFYLKRSHGRLYFVGVKDCCLALIADASLQHRQLTQIANTLAPLL